MSVLHLSRSILSFCTSPFCCRGARHGLKLNGKLARIEEQERLKLAEKLNQCSGVAIATDQLATTRGETRKKVNKSKKRKKEKKDEDEHKEHCEGMELGNDVIECLKTVDVELPVVKSKKKKRKRDRIDNETVSNCIENVPDVQNGDMGQNTEKRGKEKSKKKKRRLEDDVEVVGNNTNNLKADIEARDEIHTEPDTAVINTSLHGADEFHTEPDTAVINTSLHGADELTESGAPSKKKKKSKSKS